MNNSDLLPGPLVPEGPDPNKETRKRIGCQLKACRENLGLTIRGLAKLTGIGHGHIARIEGGRLNVSIDTLGKLTDALGCQINIEEL